MSDIDRVEDSLITGQVSTTDDLVRARNTSFGIRLFIGADASFFLAFVFAYLYLKTIDTPDLWMGTSNGPSVLLGVLGAGALLIGAIALGITRRGLDAGAAARWGVGAWIAVVTDVVAIVAIAWQLLTIGYNPSGYDSLLIGWSAALGLHLLVMLPILVGSARSHDVAGKFTPAEAASMAAVATMWIFLAAVGLLGFVLLDLIR